MKRKTESEYASTDDYLLAEMSAAGDNKAFSELILRHQKAMKQYISLYCPNTADAEDVCQESFRKAFQSIASYNPEYPFKTWLLYIGRNSAIDHIRRKKSYMVIDADWPEKTIAEINKRVNSPEDEMIDSQIYSSFINTLDNLPVRYRKIARMRFVDEFCYEDIAKELNLPLNTVKTRIRRAKLMISKILKDNI